MKSNKEHNNKSAYLKFALYIIASLLVGAMFGYFSADIRVDKIQDFVKDNAQKMAIVDTILFAVFNLVMAICAFVFYFKEKNRYKTIGQTDESILDEIDYKLSIPLLLGNIALIVNFIFFSIGFYFDSKYKLKGTWSTACVITDLSIFIIGYVWILAVQNLSVKLCKEINPEKKGNIFDKNFQKDWLNSCDEAQQLMVYKASYKSFKVTAMVCNAVMVLAMVGMLVFNTGLLAIIGPCIIFLALNVSYVLEAMKLEKVK